MRPKVVLAVVACGLLVLIALVAARRGGRNNISIAQDQTIPGSRIHSDSPRAPGRPQSADETVTGGPDTIFAAASKSGSSTLTVPAATTASSNSSAGLSHEEFVDQRVSELMDLAMNDDAGSLNTIVSELNNADPDIRKGALEAVKQFGSSDAIPKLEEVASRTDSAVEKRSIEEAIDFLKLPSLTARSK